ncbi:acylphosphatase [Tatumella sp. JGM100]|nr:acylphosphatase [Tatumella sp. JGM16]MBS0878157.1 acylphosphatase [Tatumella sp. JGM82]MBS0889869.1 acylphosphatase [Tatumella sp. JGM94]MBS0892450.1 acylphosphatase [Tatumella sp. JGM130]MBS0902870.1 acylphosphatase [Tatumella sp. JGM100]MBS0911711.1 acylphosphatase [Tatumella sp. JGM91]
MQVMYKVRVSGRVQGVFFRGSTRQQAIKYRVSGYAKNLPDGSVEILLAGDVRDVDHILAWISAGGPPAASVAHVGVQQITTEQQIRGFITG